MLTCVLAAAPGRRSTTAPCARRPGQRSSWPWRQPLTKARSPPSAYGAEKVKPFGFTYVRDFNGIPGADYWVAPATGLDTEALAALLDDWGWAATIYDGAD